MRILSAILFLVVLAMPLPAQYLYKTQLLRAAPGKLLDLIELLQNRMPYYDRVGDERPFMMRHSQGDHWDLLLLYPVESYRAFYAPSQIEKRADVATHSAENSATFQQKFDEYVSWDEDVFVTGPPLADVQRAFEGAGFFHVEMFHALPGKHRELFKQRQMENAYLRHLDRPQNLIFVRDQGAVWDLFTVGFYRDLKHFAESADISEEDEEKAARTAGFESVSQISPYLRSLISRHNDTLAVPVK